ncbi:MAG: M20/M25/M40 family metallo-hydrolase [Thermodesulfobacteriota bacterium]
MSNYSQNTAELLQKLIRFDTSNPPGNELECISFIKELLTEAGIEVQILAKSPQRPNLIARLKGRGETRPLLLYGHADVVPADSREWKHPPFAGDLVEGEVWGRGALDMKGGLAMMLAAVLRVGHNSLDLPGDVILAVVSDEETGGNLGAKFLTEEHPEKFRDVRYALGEFGGFNQSMGKHRFYPIQVAEKQICRINATVYGPGGHASIPVRNGAMSRMGKLLQTLDRSKLPVHVTPVARRMIQAIASTLGGTRGKALEQILNPRLTDHMIRLLGEQGRLLHPLLHNTVSPTRLYGSSAINVIPGQVSVDLDGRLLPGYGPGEMINELRGIIGEQVELEVFRYDHAPAEPDMGMFDDLANILQEFDPQGTPIPFLLSASTDARFFSRLGIQTYGFLPVQLPQGMNFSQLIHSPDERIPVDSLEFGTNAIYRALQLFR